MLQVSNNKVLRGTRFGANVDSFGELVFTTAMTGYELSLTDPSFAGQIVVFTFPLIGSYGIPQPELDQWGLESHFESSKIHAKGVIVLEACDSPTRYHNKTLDIWLQDQNVPGLYGVHTRQLVEMLRDEGCLFGTITDDAKSPDWFEAQSSIHNHTNWVDQVSCRIPQVLGSDQPDNVFLVVDCGIKNSILRALLSIGDTQLRVVPYDHDITEEVEDRYYDGIVISNGPGDPRILGTLIDHIKTQISDGGSGCHILGICLGHQLLALAAGASVYKMTYGNRGLNQSCIDLRTSLGYITSQNHGYAVDEKTLGSDWIPLFVNANDHSNEGIVHIRENWMGVQFHPEANPGCSDTLFVIEDFVTNNKNRKLCQFVKPITGIKKVLLLGSGGLLIAQAGEFDYSGAQAIKALQEENIEVVLINPNIATVQTTPSTYYYPITVEFVTKVIEIEKPQGILLQFGGQTALNCGLAMREVLLQHNVQVLGTSLDTILMTEDRAAFAAKMAEIGEKTIQSFTVSNVLEAICAANKIGYPVLVRAGFTLGGLGSGFANNSEELQTVCERALQHSEKIIIDKSLYGYKELEYELVRDCQSNCIAVCNMENFDPVGIHTGDSIVVAPSQTLTNAEYFGMRKTAINVINKLGVIGECNIQFALDPITSEYFIIEVNARLSRSSALASKATGYPLAYVAAKLALGKLLKDIPNPMTGHTCALFEPSMDYVVVKVPHWDFSKFDGVSRQLGTAMKSVGECMGIGCTFEEAFMKAMRMNSIGFFESTEWSEINTDKRIQAILTAMRSGKSVEWIASETRINDWFLNKLKKLVDCETEMRSTRPVNPVRLADMKLPDLKSLVYWKKMGFSDDQIAFGIDILASKVSEQRRRFHIFPGSNFIDTSSGEFKAQSNYKYLSYHTEWKHPGSTLYDRSVIVLGCGTYRIGSSCEFDWCAVNTLRTLRKAGIKCTMINHNPETVSTDFDECDELYFEELSLETIQQIYQTQAALGVIVSVGGQIPNCLADSIEQLGMTVLGTSVDNICLAEDRKRFSQLMDDNKIAQPEWAQSVSSEQALEFSGRTGYPVLVRPSFVLSGSAMNVAYTPDQLIGYLELATDVSPLHPVVISKFFENSREIEFDGIASGGKIIVFAISEHVENAGTHSGDASLMLPAQKIYTGTLKKLRVCSAKIAQLLNITGPFNIQYLCKNNNIFVIECNLRASRSLPFVSKTLNVNFIEVATRAIMGLPINNQPISMKHINHVCVKVAMFSYSRLSGADPVSSGCEMGSTGEVACFAEDANEAFLLGMMSSGFKIPRKNILVTIGSQKHKQDFVASMLALKSLGFTLFGTNGTCKFYAAYGIEMTEVSKAYESKDCNAVEMIRAGGVDMVINIPNQEQSQHVSDGFRMRRAAIDAWIPLISNLQNAELMVEAFVQHGISTGCEHPFDFTVRKASSYF